MKNGAIALIGLGAIGVPIADKLNSTYGEDFVLVASGARRERLEKDKLFINNNAFYPKVISDKAEILKPISLLIVCVKNYDLDTSLADIKQVVSKETVILPLQNGIFSYEFFSKEFPKNTVLHGYVQGPNTRTENGNFYYKNAGVMHIGDSADYSSGIADQVYKKLSCAGVEVRVEANIRKMVGKKWMLNVAGNSVTALTGADYSQFKNHIALQNICRTCMQEFIRVAQREAVELNAEDIEDIIKYYVSYIGDKKTSILMDVLNARKTENEYLAGALLRKAGQYGLWLPVTSTLYYLVKAKESIYMENKEFWR